MGRLGLHQLGPWGLWGRWVGLPRAMLGGHDDVAGQVRRCSQPDITLPCQPPPGLGPCPEAELQDMGLEGPGITSPPSAPPGLPGIGAGEPAPTCHVGTQQVIHPLEEALQVLLSHDQVITSIPDPILVHSLLPGLIRDDLFFLGLRRGHHLDHRRGR